MYAGIYMSKTKLKNATYSVFELIKAASIPSHKTKSDNLAILKRCMVDLHELGYKLSHVRGLKEKHVPALITHWKNTGLQAATIKNYTAKLRWAFNEMGKSIKIKNNDHYGIEKRSYIQKNSKAIEEIDISNITNHYIKLSIQAQQLFGLRREESLKLIVSEADQGDFLYLKGSWTKGGIPRKIPILSEKQRIFLNEVHKIVGKNASLIPKDITNKEQINCYVSQVRRAGMKNLHGLRHAYAQERYFVLTNQLTGGKGWNCPFKNGKAKAHLTKHERSIDSRARIMLSQELGHSRRAITKTYIG
jgi:hypothetical protein